MLRRVALVITDVWDELSASFIRVTRIRELGKMLPVTSNEPHGVTSQKTPFFIVTTVKTSNPTYDALHYIYFSSQNFLFLFFKHFALCFIFITTNLFFCSRYDQNISCKMLEIKFVHNLWQAQVPFLSGDEGCRELKAVINMAPARIYFIRSNIKTLKLACFWILGRPLQLGSSEDIYSDVYHLEGNFKTKLLYFEYIAVLEFLKPDTKTYR
jgi:hypothetical protein